MRGFKGVIYSISDDTGVKYIGQTTNEKKRFAQHLSLSQNRGYRNVQKWLFNLLINDEHPIFQIIERTNDLDERERYWISFYRKNGAVLLNMNDGGSEMSAVSQAKVKYPWYPHHSPMQRRLKTFAEHIRFLRKNGEEEQIKIWKCNLILLNKVIKKVGLQEMNRRLYAKYGK